MNSKEVNRGQIKRQIDREWSVGNQESLFEAAEQRMIDKIVRGGYLQRRDGVEFTDEFREKLLEERGLKLFAAIESQADESLMLFFNVKIMPDKVMQVSRTDQGDWQAALVNMGKNSFGSRVIEAEKLDRNSVCIEKFGVEPDYEQEIHYNWVKKDGKKQFEWKLVWSKNWRNKNEERKFKKRFVEMNKEISFTRDREEVEGY